MGRSFEVELDIDFCNQKLTFGVEKLTETLSLQGFEYGMCPKVNLSVNVPQNVG